MIIGARGADDNGPNSGAAYIFLGSSTPLATLLASSANTMIVGADSNAQLGRMGVSVAGDFNGDGTDDAFVSTGVSGQPASYIVFGVLTPPALVVASNADVVIDGPPATASQGTRIGVGDVNGDGIPTPFWGSGGSTTLAAESWWCTAP